jgi:hypothetical protein
MAKNNRWFSGQIEVHIDREESIKSQHPGNIREQEPKRKNIQHRDDKGEV